MSEVQKCRECGGDNLLWTQCNSNKTGVAEGRLRTHEVTCSFVLGCEDCSETISVISADKFIANYDAAKVDLAALREELAIAKDQLVCVEQVKSAISQRLTATEQRNEACNSEIVAMVESALRRSFSLGQVYWQQADSDSTCQQNKSDQTMEVQAQHILNVVKSINALTKPTESGASE